MNNKVLLVLCGALAGAAVASIIALSVMNKAVEDVTNQNSSEKKILYWVAPMDANYRRDKPGKSPMGMELVPVYESSDDNQSSSAGTVKISPEIVNNLGVRLEKISKKAMVFDITTVGYITFDEDLVVNIYPRLEGWIETLYVKSEGESVSKGQALYRIYSPELVNAQEELLFALQRSNKRLINAAKLRLKALQVSKETINAVIKTRKVRQNITFYAPKDGVVKSLNVRQGHFVKPSTEIMSIGSIDQVWVEVEVFEKQLPWVQLGAEVQMTVDFLPSRKWIGTIDYIYPTLDKNSRTAKVRVKFSNQDESLKPNMYAKISISAEQTNETLFVSRDAVIRTGFQDKVVLALGEGKFKSIEVTTGLKNHDFIEIKHGLKVGDEVVVSAQFLIDSESSKTSDFKRMTQEDMPEMESTSNMASTDGMINSIDEVTRVINISRGPIEKWNRPAATMNFKLSDEIDINTLNVGELIEFTFEVADDFIILELTKQKTDASSDEPHSQHDTGKH